MARSMWRGAIQFGLVTIPVKLYLATETGGIGFNMLHQKDLSRIQMKVYCPVDDEVISRSDTVRGYEWSKGKYVVITDEDLESVPLKTVRSIEIEAFVPADEAEEKGARFVKQAYYLEPDEIGRKAFYLLKSVLAETNKTAICKIVLKDREQLAALNPFDKTMLLQTLHWPDEIRSLEELNLPEEEIEIKPAERKMAEQLIASMGDEFDPERGARRVPRGADAGDRGQGRRREAGSRQAGRADQDRRPDGRPGGERLRRPRVAAHWHCQGREGGEAEAGARQDHHRAQAQGG